MSALSQGVVNLGTSWSHKYEELYREYGVFDLLIDPNASEEELIELMNSMFTPDQPYVNHINENAVKYKEITEAMWSVVVNVVNKLK